MCRVSKPINNAKRFATVHPTGAGNLSNPSSLMSHRRVEPSFATQRTGGTPASVLKLRPDRPALPRKMGCGYSNSSVRCSSASVL